MSGEDNESNERLVENPPQAGENQPANGEIVPAESAEGERNVSNFKLFLYFILSGIFQVSIFTPYPSFLEKFLFRG